MVDGWVYIELFNKKCSWSCSWDLGLGLGQFVYAAVE
jgi:hypothetical protein